MSSKPPDPQRDAKILRAAQAGLGTAEVAARFGLSPNGVRSAIERAKAAAGATAAARAARA